MSMTGNENQFVTELVLAICIILPPVYSAIYISGGVCTKMVRIVDRVALVE